ncbi:MAG: alpha/beta hydrolase [Mycoplasmatales bacterium]|nr:alpha/beta hydrolase [Mycoplasmatales bacterium]
MEKITEHITYKKKELPVRVHIGNNPKFIFVTHHGLLSNNTSFRYLEKWVGESGIVVNYDARSHGSNKMKASRFGFTYVNDFRDIVRWTKKRFPNIPIITIGSSWGASIVAGYAKKYGVTEVFKNVAWSIPYNFLFSEESKEAQKKDKDEIDQYKKLQIKKPTIFSWTWKMIVVILTNFNTKEYVKLDLQRTANNDTLNRMNKINKPKPTPVKLFYSAGKLILISNRRLKKINKNENAEFLYIQSTMDTYLTKNKLKQVKKWTGKGVESMFLNEGKHAFQWEVKNNLNEKVFQIVVDWATKKRK